MTYKELLKHWNSKKIKMLNTSLNNKCHLKGIDCLTTYIRNTKKSFVREMILREHSDLTKTYGGSSIFDQNLKGGHKCLTKIHRKIICIQ